MPGSPSCRGPPTPRRPDTLRAEPHRTRYSASREGDAMTVPRKRKPHSLAVRTAELAVAVPQVVAHRVTRMALAGPVLSARDRREFARMVAEKNAAFGEAWQAMAMQAAVANQALAASTLRAFVALAAGRRPRVATSAAQLHRAALGVLGKGLAPVHRKATANARRLARTKLR